MTRKRNWPRLGKAVRKRRQELDLGSQKEAADLAGVSLNTWSRLESGTPVSNETVDAAAKVLQWDISVPLTLLAADNETVNAKATPAPVEAKAGIPGPAVRHPLAGQPEAAESITSAPSVVPISPEVSVLLVPVPLTGDDAKELDEEDLSWVSHQVKTYGLDMITAIARTKRAKEGR